MRVEDYYSQQSKTDREVAIEVIRRWSEDNIHSDIDWRTLHAASLQLAIQLHRAGSVLKELKRTFHENRDNVDRCEAAAFQAGRLKLIGEGLSATQATEIARKSVPLDMNVVQAQIEYARSAANLAEFEIELDGLREVEQGAKSTAKMLKEEPC